MKTTQGNKHRAGEKRKGVVLLIIVTLLTLFIMIGITLSLVAINYRDSSEKVRAAGTYGDLSEKELDLALGQLLYGSQLTTSILAPHNLLGDFYGHDGVAGTVSQFVEENNGQVIKVTYQAVPAAQQPFGGSFKPLPHFYSGRVLTFTDGSAAGFSTRVMAYLPTPNAPDTGTLYVEAIESDLPVKILPTNGSRFLINGAPFNGPGFGYLDSTYNIDMDENGQDATMSGQPRVALVGNFTALTNNINFMQGGPDEPWDAADLNNWHLAVVPPAIGQQALPIIPSFHRPELINYWLYQINPMGGNINQIPIDRLRKSSLRPIGAEYGANADHPNFTGSNPNYHPINGPWDVDNNGDGIADSIWVDAGLPIVTGKDGRKYKRLFAYLVMDLDGRINVNVHGNLQQTVAQNRADQGTTAMGLFPGGTNLSRGSGYGVGEIDFLSVFGNFTTANDLTAYGTLLTQRYGTDGLPGQANVREGFSIVKHHGTPNDYANIPPVQEWASPPDVWGRGALALDTSGNAITQYMGQTGEMLDTPYEIQVGKTALSTDAPYTVAEMEALLRYHDAGAATLASRLFNSGSGQAYLNSSSRGVLGVDHRRREVLTTHTSYVPVAMTRVPREYFTPNMMSKPGATAAQTYITSPNQRNLTLLNLYVYKLILEGAVASDMDPAVVNHLNQLVPWEVRQGQLFNINRFLGDGWDNNGDGVADDYNEAGSGAEPAWLAAPQVPPSFQGVTAWHTNDTDVDGNGTFNGQDFVYARQLYARHLFCLMMALMDDGYIPPFPPENPPLSPTDQQELNVRRIAQWAINVVDFRDSDAVMSGFEYDVNPFNGWQVDGNLGTDGSVASPEIINGAPVQSLERRVVWGVEFPDLVLTETIGMHNRGTRDTNLDTTMQNVDGGDDDADQLRLPQGSLFVELYCPRAKYNNNPRLPQELYVQYAPGQWRLALQKLAPQPSLDGVQRPVWRLAISEHIPGSPNSANVPWTRKTSSPTSTSFEPSNMSLLPPTGPVPQLTIDRYVWFSSVDPPATATAMVPSEYGRTFVNNLGWDVSVEPGQYAVVGPRTVTYMGSATDGDPTTTFHDGDSPQGIQLTQINPPPGGNGVVVTDLNGMQTYTAGTQIKNVVGIVADMAPPAAWVNQAKRVGLNVTQPLPLIDANNYAEPTFPNDAYDDMTMPTGTFLDAPFDAQPGFPLADWNMYPTATYDNVRAIFLQRLADPNAAWHPQYNPYITIDWASTDVTVFTGEDTPNVPTTGGASRDPADPMPSPADPAEFRFGTRQKGLALGSPVDVNLWTNFWPDPNVTAAAGIGTSFFDYDLVDSLGYLNPNLGTPQPENMATAQIELGDPAEGPFPWLAHLDRPLMSPMELLMVPAWSQARLTQEFQPLGQPGTPRNFDPYKEVDPNTGMPNPNFAPPFTQLLNFFHTGNPNGAFKISPQFTRLFDYIEVPSPFSGTEKWFNPGNTNQQFGDPMAGTTVASMYRPPFNKLSRFADPGRININTIYDDAVLEAALGSFPFPGNTAQNQAFRRGVIFSRQGYISNNPLDMDYRYPTRFANPVRPADAADLMPDVADMRRVAPAEATLLRSNYVFNAVTNPPPAAPPAPTPTDTPLFDVPNNPIYNYNDPNRNAYFEYQAFQKIGNVFSTQSNVFAVWITVGYFEVEPNPNGVDVAHPDGYRLGQEIGADSGNTVRHRFFSIIDRTVPAAYEPGKRHNTDKCILLRRFIE